MVVAQVDTAPRSVKPQPHWLIADRLGQVKPTRAGEDNLPFQNNASFHTSTTLTNGETVTPRVDTAPDGVETPTVGEDKVPSPDHPSFHTSATATNRGRKRRSLGSIPPHTVRKPQSHWLIA